MERQKDISCMDPHFLMPGGVDYIKEPELRVEVTAEEPAEKPIDLWSEE